MKKAHNWKGIVRNLRLAKQQLCSEVIDMQTQNQRQIDLVIKMIQRETKQTLKKHEDIQHRMGVDIKQQTLIQNCSSLLYESISVALRLALRRKNARVHFMCLSVIILLKRPDSLYRGVIALKCEYKPTKISKARWVCLAIHRGQDFLGWCKAANPKVHKQKPALNAIGPALKSKVQIQHITQVLFGARTKNFKSQKLVLHPQKDDTKDVVEWCCFSVVTQERTYDFIFQNCDEKKAFQFVVALRHLHSQAAPHRLR